ncbi:precorrin-2 dehydrogenase/sirohydrochlorin ferrochelatase family protein [Cohnella candidum]|uniref:precorrin-2 dehydrogenase n=1 Tax=Cohnella candidum TaxID=2674991 RepID=A0A3G3JZE3_9BACL|nr:NAD(P)-dependent oxidoreductase [Cohnella candidum]AYQ73227.1 bifunctional precorrin-2 dehydrogenase/sirohydrochlorin ferrochelatase [Cohnella candidum]
MAEWYPVMLRMEGKLAVVIGGGPVAERKVCGLLEAGAQIRVVSPELTEGLRTLAEVGRLEWRQKEAEASDLAGATLVFAAAGSSEANLRITAAAAASGIPVNAAEDGEAGDFILPAVLRRGRFILTASVSGAGPALASRVVRELETRYGPEYAEYADELRRIRRIVKERVSSREERRRLLAAAAETDALEEWRTTGIAAEPDRLLERLRDRAGSGQDREKR